MSAKKTKATQKPKPAPIPLPTGPQQQPAPAMMPQAAPMQGVVITMALRERILRKLDTLPRGEVNDVYLALESSPTVNVETGPVA